MGKKTGQAQRTKGNAQPSSSAKAAEMLQKVASNLENYGFGSKDLAPIGIGTLLEDTFDSNLDSDFRMVLKKLYKKDAFTKQKSLEELKCLIEAKSQADCVFIVPYWAKLYTKLSIDYDRKIRELCQQTHEKLSNKVTKSMAPHLKTIVPYWLLSQSDTYAPAARVAENCFKIMFNEAKQPEVVNFAREEIIDTFNDYLIVETAKTLSDMKTTSLDEAEQKYENLLCITMRALCLFLRYLFSENSRIVKCLRDESESNEVNRFLEKLEKLLLEPKFWKFSKENSLKLRGEFYQMLCSLTDLLVLNQSLISIKSNQRLANLRKNFNSKLIPLVFYALDEDNATCSHFVWQSIIKLIRNSNLIEENLWSYLNVKKAFVPKLISLLKNHSNANANSQNVEHISMSLHILLKSLLVAYSDNFEEKLGLMRDLMTKLHDAIWKEASSGNKPERFSQAANRKKISLALIDCFVVILDNFESEFDSVSKEKVLEFVSNYLLDYFLKLVESYLISINQPDSAFEAKFRLFFDSKINRQVDETLPQCLLMLQNGFWERLKSLIDVRVKKTVSQEAFHIHEEIESAKSLLNFIANFGSLFRDYWLNSANKNTNIRPLIESIFKHTIENFKCCLNRTIEDQKSITELASIYLECLNALVTSFFDTNMLNNFLDKSESVSLEEFNREFIQRLIQSDLNSSLIFEISELYLRTNLALNAPNKETILSNLDSYLFLNENLNATRNKAEFLLKIFVLKIQSNKIDSSIRTVFTQYIINSDKLKNVLLNEILNGENLFSDSTDFKMKNYELAFELLDVLLGHVSNELNKDRLTEELFDSCMKNSVSFLESLLKTAGLNDSFDLDKLNNYLKFNQSFFPKLSNKYFMRCMNVNKFWSVFLNNLILYESLKLNLAVDKRTQIESNLNVLIGSLATIMLGEYLIENIDKTETFGELNTLIKKQLNGNELFLNKVLLDLINCFESTFKNNSTLSNRIDPSVWLDKFYTQVLLNISNKSSEKDLFFAILFGSMNENSQVNSSLLRKLYLNHSFNYLYSDLHHKMLGQDSAIEYYKVGDLNQLNYVVTLLNSYFRKPSLDHEAFIKKILNVNSDWIYLINILLAIDLFAESDLALSAEAKFEEFEARKSLMHNLRIELDQLLYETSFLKLALDYINSKHVGFDGLIDLNDKLELNSVSFFFNGLLEKLLAKMDKNKELVHSLNEFALSLLRNSNQNEEMIFYLYEIPFAKLSILDNVNKLSENIDHYYAVFANLIQKTIDTQLVVLIEQLKTVNDQNSPILIELLKGFNNSLNVLTKYVKIYFDLVYNSQSSSSTEPKLYNLFNLNEKTNDFIQNVLSRFLNRILNELIELKKTSTHGYFFFFNFDQTCFNINELEWMKLMFLDKLNMFLELFFLAIKKTEKMCDYLQDFHWDFILCYSSSLSQWLGKVLSKQKTLKNEPYLQIFLINFTEYLHYMIKSIKYETLEANRPDGYAKNVSSDWSGFFSKEIFDPLLNTFVKLSVEYEHLMNETSLKFEEKNFLVNLSMLVAEISFDCLLKNTLEPKFNVLDLEMPSEMPTKLINLADSLKTVINHLVPNLRHKLAPIQLSSYYVLRVLFKEVYKYLDSEKSEEKSSNIVQSLPHAFREAYTDLIELFSDVKNSIPFEQSILSNESEMTHETNSKIMSYLLINKLVLDLFSNENLELRVRLVQDLRETKFTDTLLNVLFRVLPSFNAAAPKSFEPNFDSIFEPANKHEFWFSNEFVREFSCMVYKQSLRFTPAMVRDWWNTQPKRIADQVDKYTAKYVSPVLLEEEIRQINRSSCASPMKVLLNSIEKMNINSLDDENESTIKIKGMLSTREIVSIYSMKDLNMELVIKLPHNYPLGVVQVSSVKRLGVSESEWRNWLLQLTTYLTHQNGSIVQALHIWKRNVDKKFSGVEECTICYSVIHGTNYQLPKMKCRTCKKLFHSVCLYKWFESSSKSSCPLCRNLF